MCSAGVDLAIPLEMVCPCYTTHSEGEILTKDGCETSRDLAERRTTNICIGEIVRCASCVEGGGKNCGCRCCRGCNLPQTLVIQPQNKSTFLVVAANVSHTVVRLVECLVTLFVEVTTVVAQG